MCWLSVSGSAQGQSQCVGCQYLGQLRDSLNVFVGCQYLGQLRDSLNVLVDSIWVSSGTVSMCWLSVSGSAQGLSQCVGCQYLGQLRGILLSGTAQGHSSYLGQSKHGA